MEGKNLLGRNIQRLREIHGNTLEELGAAIGYAKSTIKGYENGSRKPDPNTIKAIANYYGKTVDELINTDLTGLEKIDTEQFTLYSSFEIFKNIMPLFSSEKAMNNTSFRKGYDLSQKILKAFSDNQTLRGSIISDVTELYIQAIDETEAPEAVANFVWCVFVWWLQLFDSEKMIALQNKLLLKKIDMIEVSREIKRGSTEAEKKRKEFISDMDEVLNESIKALKSDEEWSDLGDYYLALRYVFGLVDTDLSAEMNMTIGIQLLTAYARLENKYAIAFFLCNQ